MTRLVVISGGVSDPSSTRLLADRAAGRVQRFAPGLEVDVIELRPLAAEIAEAQITGFPAGGVLAAAERIASADALLVATPVYKAGVSGLVKSFLDVLDPDLFIALPTLLVATAGTARHALVVDGELRSLFAYLRALTVPTSLFAAGEDWASPELTDRTDRAANELAVLIDAGVRDRMRTAPAGRYTRVFGGAAGSDDVDLDTDLMRLARGGD